MISKVTKDDALDPQASAVRRRRKLGAMFLAGLVGFIGVTAGGVWKLIEAGVWDPNIWLAMMACGSIMAAAAGIYQWAGTKRDGS